MFLSWISLIMKPRKKASNHRHRDEAAEYEEQMIYLNRRAGDPTLAKDIRIFGLRPWIEELYAKSMAALPHGYRGFSLASIRSTASRLKSLPFASIWNIPSRSGLRTANLSGQSR